MESHKLVVKLFADPAAASRVSLGAVVPVFHGWIREQSLEDHLLIDVADYEHVPDGPGTVLVAHEANIHFDREAGRPGVLYIRKQPIAGAETFRERLATVFCAALQAAAKLEAEPALAGIRFPTNEVAFRINDRLLAPNEDATFAAVKPALAAFLKDVYRGDVALEYRADALRLFEVRIKSAGNASVTDLLSRLESAASAPAR